MTFLEALRKDNIGTPEVWQAMTVVDRQDFIASTISHYAGENSALPIACGQTISQPTVVAMMTALAIEHRPQKILEIGTGSGYQAAILAKLVPKIYSIERHARLYQEAVARFKKLRLDNIACKHGDGWQGWADHAPFDAVMVTAAASEMPSKLLAQMRIGAVMVIPLDVKTGYGQMLKRIVKTGEEDYSAEDIAPVVFVPFVKNNQN